MTSSARQPQPPQPPYGQGDASFQAAGGIEGIRQLVDAFYVAMDTLPAAAVIRAMHPTDLTVARDKLHLFLCGWLGGEKHYAKKYGPITIPTAHAHLPIGAAERDQWLLCMQQAVAAQPYPEDFQQYLMVQLAVPAERIRQACAARASGSSARE